MVTATEVATEEIRELIAEGIFAPGQRINVDELAERFEMSRTPIREALQALRSEGLVEIQARIGVFVRQISRQEVEDVYGLKGALEPMAAAWAATRGSEADRQALLAMTDRLREAAATDDVRDCARCVEDIHTKLFEMAASEPLLEVYRVLRDRVKLLRYRNMAQPGRLQASVEQHARIVDAIVAGDADSAHRFMHQHMTDAIRSLRRALVDDEHVSSETADTAVDA